LEPFEKEDDGKQFFKRMLEEEQAWQKRCSKTGLFASSRSDEGVVCTRWLEENELAWKPTDAAPRLLLLWKTHEAITSRFN